MKPPIYCNYDITFRKLSFLIPVMIIQIFVWTGCFFEIYAETGEEILKKALNTEGMLDFTGTSKTISYMKPYDFSNEANVSYRQHGMCRMEYKGSGASNIVVINKDNSLLRYDRVKRIVFRTIAETSPQNAEDKKKLLFENYKVIKDGEEKVAGRDTYLIEVSSKYPGRPYKKLWIDKSNYAILSSKLYNPDNSLQLVTYFTSVDFNSTVPENAFNIPREVRIIDIDEGPKKITSIDDFSKHAGFRVIQPSWLPPGFVLDGVYTYQCQCGVEMAHLRYFDGLTSISIFEGPKKCPRCDEGFSWKTMMRGRMRMGRGCSPASCELLEQSGENLRAFFNSGTRFIIIGTIAESDLDTLRKNLEKNEGN